MKILLSVYGCLGIPSHNVTVFQVLLSASTQSWRDPVVSGKTSSHCLHNVCSTACRDEGDSGIAIGGCCT